MRTWELKGSVIEVESAYHARKEVSATYHHPCTHPNKWHKHRNNLLLNHLNKQHVNRYLTG